MSVSSDRCRSPAMSPLAEALTKVLPARHSLILGSFLALGVVSAQAATYTVNSTGDPGDGTCDANECTLREAINAATATPEADLVDATGVAGTVMLDGGTPLFIGAGGDLEVRGPGADQLTVSGDGTSSVFYINNDASHTITGLTVTAGGAEGGIANYTSDLTLDGVAVVGNSGSLYGAGGGISSLYGSNLTIRNSLIANNNTAGFYGGGGLFFGFGGDLLIENSTFSGNAATYGGGFGAGGGIFIYAANSAELNFVTITDNSAFYGGGIGVFDADATIQNSIVAGNSASIFGPDLYGFLQDDSFNADYNLIGDATDATLNETVMGSNLIGADPMLGGLADNGGPTQTHLPAAGSAAIDAADPAAVSSTDQRGEARPQGAAADMGAVEQAAVVAPVTPPIAIPTLSSFAMVLLGGLAALGGMLGLKRRARDEFGKNS